MTKTKLHRMGYRKGIGCYYKTRRCRVRPESKVTVQVQLRTHGWFDVASREAGSVDHSQMLKGVRALKQWERFAFC